MTGKALRCVRLALSLSLQQFADQIGIPVADLDAFERGDALLDQARLSRGLERLTPRMVGSAKNFSPSHVDAPERGVDHH